MSVFDIDDEVVNGLENAIREKEERCELLRSRFYDLLDTKASPLKDRLIDATIDDFSTRRMGLVSQCEQLMDDIRSLKLKSEPLRCDIEGLEVVKERLEKSLELSNMILDIRSIESELKEAIDKEDYEKATQQIVQYRSIMSRGSGLEQGPEKSIIESIKGSERQLVQIVGRKFREGVVRKDRQIVSDFARLFYPLNLHKEGIYCYINFLRESMSNQCAANFKALSNRGTQHQAGIHSQLAGNVFMAVADLIQEHQKNVETQFGPETYLLFLRGLEEEADIQIVRILDHFESEHSGVLSLTEESMSNEQLRDIDLVLDELSSLSFRCQQFTEYIHQCGHDIMLSIDSTAIQQLTDHSSTTPLSSTSSSNTPSYSPLHGLSVLSLMMVRIQELMGTYVSSEHSFASRSINRAMQDAEISLTEAEPVTSTLPDDVFFMLRKCITRAIASCDVFSVCAIVNLLTAKLGEVRTHLHKCLQVSARLYTEWLARHFTGTFSDRGVGDLPNFSLALRSAAEQRDFDPTDLGALSTVFGGGRPLDGPQSTVTTCPSILSWPTCMNDLTACIEYIGTLVKTCEEEFAERWEVPDAERANSNNVFADIKSGTTTTTKQSTTDEGRHFMFQQCLLGFESAKKEFQSTCSEYYNDFVNVMLQPVLVPGLRQFETLNFNIDQSTYADYQINDPFMSRFISRLEFLITHLKTAFTPTPLNSLIEALIDRLTSTFEESILKKKFTLLGAVQLEKDVRSLSTSLTSSSDQPLRYKFSRLLEISEILNVGSVEELRQLSDPLSLAKSWKLSVKEIQNLMMTRIDLPSDELDNLFNDPTFAEY